MARRERMTGERTMAIRGPFVFRTKLPARVADVWAHASSMSGVNLELSPFLRMTAPDDAMRRSLAYATPGEELFPSTVLLFGIVPVERWHLRLVEIGPGERFVESSRTATMHVWRHERTVRSVDGGAEVEDAISFEPKLPVVGAIAERLVRSLFSHRHATLARIFAGR